MKISICVAMDKNRVIGHKNKMPWHLSADLQYFKDITMGKPILMGRKTFESIGRPLPGRENIIISRNHDYKQQGCQVYHSIEAAIAICKDSIEIMVIGGASFYQAVLPMASHIYLTQIHDSFAGDTFFPEFDRSQWKEIKRQDITDDQTVSFNYSFITLENKNPPGF
jgi:dihydrofolate reductase